MKDSLYRQIRRFNKKDKISFHMPGHKGGSGLSSRLKRNAFELDVTEFDETDDLLSPVSVLKDAQERAAEVFGAAQSFYLTNGSSSGLHAAILGSVPKGGKLLVDRTCHRAVIAALVMGEIDPVFVDPQFDTELGIYTGMTPEAVNAALDETPDVAGMVLTSPTYYGVCTDIAAIARLLHERRKFLIVDEAHGAHFVFSSKLPPTALEQGADISIQSLHKTLPALGQCSLLHIGHGAVIDARQVERQLRLRQTTSPSYLLMTSIDEAVQQMQDNGKRLDEMIEQLYEIKTRLTIVNRLSCLSENKLSGRQDLLRLVVSFEKAGLSGHAAADLLKREYGIYPEMADEKNVVFLVTIGNSKRDLDALAAAFEEIGEAEHGTPAGSKPAPLPEIEVCFAPCRAWNSERETVAVQESAGKICADIVASCPPGAAVLIPGQLVSREAADYLAKHTEISFFDVVK